MKLSMHYSLGVTQHELDFIDIDPDTDTRLFVDPHFLAQRDDPFSISATATIRNFFTRFLELVKEKDFPAARGLFDYLHEPNETCLGMSSGKPRGAGVSAKLADMLFTSLSKSRAVKSGLIEHIEDVRLFVPGVDKDKISDMVTNIIRKHLVIYTQNQCRLWGIPLTVDRPSGPFWDPTTQQWNNEFTEMMVHDFRNILLVPKGIVSYSKAYTSIGFHRMAVLPFLQHEHLRLNTLFVQTSKNKDGKERKFVTKESLVRGGESPGDKDYLSRFTERHKSILRNFQKKAAASVSSLPSASLDSRISLRDVAGRLIESIKEIPTGNSSSGVFHKWCASALELIFYPDLICPVMETPRDGGRKRIDITFENAAKEGFFRRLHQSQGLPCSYVFIECKNYSTDPANPEVDQLNGRFGTNVGRVGLLISRSVSNEGLLIARCQDIFKNVGHLVIPLWDSDMVAMLQMVNDLGARAYEELLTDRARKIRLE